MFPILSAIIFLPVVGALFILCLRREQLNLIRWSAFGVPGLSLLLNLGLILYYLTVIVGSTSRFPPETVPWISSFGISINYSLGVDGISLLLSTLTALLTLLCIAASFRIERQVKNYM